MAGDIPVELEIIFSKDQDTIQCTAAMTTENEMTGTAAPPWWPESLGRLNLILRRTPPYAMCLRPHPKKFETDATTRRRLLWDFAIRAVCAQVRQKYWKWSVFEERRRIRSRTIELDLKEFFGRSEAEEEEYRSNIRAMSTSDANIYHLFRNRQAFGTPFQGCVGFEI